MPVRVFNYGGHSEPLLPNVVSVGRVLGQVDDLELSSGVVELSLCRSAVATIREGEDGKDDGVLSD